MIEYCLKNDVINEYTYFNITNQEAKWSKKPKYFDLLSFSGYFGSIKCFKHLIMKCFEINDHL